MSTRSQSIKRWATGGLLLGAAAMAAGRMRSHDDADFFTWSGERPVFEVRGVRVTLPAFYHRIDAAFQSVYLASYPAVRDLLPTDQLRPVRWVDGRAVVLVAALRYQVISGDYGSGAGGFLTPYGEIMIAPLVTRLTTVPVAPLLLRAVAPGRLGAGAFVLHLPVTTLEACDLGRELYGLPKFVADMDFDENPTYQQVRLGEDGTEILTMTVRPRGRTTLDRRPMVLYCALRGELLEITVPSLGHARVVPGGLGGELTLGRHPVAEQLRGLDISRTPVLTTSYLDLRMILPAGRPVGSAADYQGHAGARREHGRYTVRYPGTEPVDQYADLPRVLPIADAVS